MLSSVNRPLCRYLNSAAAQALFRADDTIQGEQTAQRFTQGNTSSNVWRIHHNHMTRLLLCRYLNSVAAQALFRADDIAHGEQTAQRFTQDNQQK